MILYLAENFSVRVTILSISVICKSFLEVSWNPSGKT